MALAVAVVPIALSAIKALLRYRERVDEVLSLSAVTQGLPFRLPPAPKEPFPHLNAMLVFFQTDHGKAVLELQGLRPDFDAVLQAVTTQQPRPAAALNNCFALYFEACEVNPMALLPADASAGERRRFASSGPSQEMRLAYYVVESDRLSRNTPLTRLVLITVDTLLEVVGDNAGVFVSNPRTRPLVEALLKEFAVDNDFDDESAADIFRQLIGATAFAALDNPSVLPNKPALTALYSAINDVRKALKDKHGPEKARDVLGRLMTRDGFERVVNSYVTQVAKDPSFITGSALAQKAIRAALLEIEGKFFDLFKDDPQARYRVLEALMAVGADHVQSLLGKEVAPDRPFTAAVLSALVAHVGTQSSAHQLFKEIAHGEILGDLYAVALTAVANSPEALTSELQVSDLVRELVSGLAAALSEVPVSRTLQRESLQKLMSVALTVLSRHPGALGAKDGLAAKVLTSALDAAAAAIGDGITADDVEAVVDAALRTAADNVGLAGLGDTTQAVLQAVTVALADANLRSLTQAPARRDLLLAALAGVAANPTAWSGLRSADLVKPLVQGLLEVARTGRGTNLLSDSTMVEAVRLTLLAASKRGRAILDGGTNGPAQLREILIKGLEFADAALGRTLDAEDVPHFLKRVVLEFFKGPFVLAQAEAGEVERVFARIEAGLEGAQQ